MLKLIQDKMADAIIVSSFATLLLLAPILFNNALSIREQSGRIDVMSYQEQVTLYRQWLENQFISREQALKINLGDSFNSPENAGYPADFGFLKYAGNLTSPYNNTILQFHVYKADFESRLVNFNKSSYSVNLTITTNKEEPPSALSYGMYLSNSSESTDRYVWIVYTNVPTTVISDFIDAKTGEKLGSWSPCTICT